MLLLLTLLACDSSQIISKDSGDALVDADGDGYLDTVDCDDADFNVNPGAVDAVADGVDQDCDGVDGVPSDTDTGGDTGADNPDADGDGYLASVDCDDGDPAIHPGAADTAGDGVDQDCDGADAEPSADADGDGYANETVHGTDCDDGDASVHPGAAETVGDGVDADCDGADFGVDGLAVGDLVVSEVMYDPDAVGDGEGEWFELVVESATSVNLEGLVVADDPAFGAADTFTVETPLVANPGDRLVFATNGDSSLNGGISADYDYAGAGVNLNNSADDLCVGVRAGGGRVTLLDSVSWDEAGSWPASKGVSIELNDGSVDAAANDSARNWCQATSRAGSTSDKGSPGATSSGC